MVTVDDVRAVVDGLPRSYEVLVRDRIKFRVGRIVYLAFSRDESVMGFAFPKEERESLVASAPEKFLMPHTSDLRYNWVDVRLAVLGVDEMRELVLDAWRMVVPKRVAEEQLGRTKESAVKHAGDEALDQLEPLLQEVRAIDGLVEKKRGVFYRKSKAWLHFHEDPSGLHADYRVTSDGDFVRVRVETKAERAAFLKAFRANAAPHSSAPAPKSSAMRSSS